MSCPHRLPRFRQGSDSVTHFEGHEHCLQRRVLDWNRIVEHDHHTVASVAFECAVILDDDFADCRMVVAQQGHHVFGVRALSEAGEAAHPSPSRALSRAH